MTRLKVSANNFFVLLLNFLHLKYLQFWLACILALIIKSLRPRSSPLHPSTFGHFFSPSVEFATFAILANAHHPHVTVSCLFVCENYYMDLLAKFPLRFQSWAYLEHSNPIYTTGRNGKARMKIGKGNFYPRQGKGKLRSVNNQWLQNIYV